VAAQEIRVRPQDVVVTPTEIYVRVSLIQKLLPVRIEVATDDLALRLRAAEKFPIQGRLQRIANRPDGAQVGIADEDQLKVAQPYAFLTPPGFDVVLDGGLNTGGPRSRDFRYDVRVAGDFLWSNFRTEDVFRFGLSSTGGDLNNPAYKKRYLDDPRGFVEWRDFGASHASDDIGLPLYWLLFGQDAGLIHSVQPVARIMADLVAEADAIVRTRLAGFVRG
jgi:hypothetical protein